MLELDLARVPAEHLREDALVQLFWCEAWEARTPERPFQSQIFQLEAKSPFDVNFGDVGAGHLLLGAGGAIDFTWASH